MTGFEIVGDDAGEGLALFLVIRTRQGRDPHLIYMI